MKNENSFKHSWLFSLLLISLVQATPVCANVNSPKVVADCDSASALCFFGGSTNAESTQVKLVDNVEFKFLNALSTFNDSDSVKNVENTQLDEVSAPVAGWLFVFALIGFVSFSNKRRV